MKSNIIWTAGSWMIAAALVVSPVFADEAATAKASADAAASTVDAAADSVQEAVETVQEIGEELGITDEVAATQVEAATQPAEATTQPAEAQADVAVDGGDPMAAAMAEWMANANPGEHHAKLDALVGNWDVTTHYWMAPGAPPQVSDGTSKIKWVLEGRYIIEKFTGSFQMPGMESQAFQGIGFTGYDNAKGEYISTWSDTMSTSMLSSVGQFDDSTQTLTLTSHFDCPMDGPSVYRMTHTIVGPDELNMQAFKTPQGSEEAKVMEIIYKRQAGM